MKLGSVLGPTQQQIVLKVQSVCLWLWHTRITD